jgi:hypothetical protein
MDLGRMSMNSLTADMTACNIGERSGKLSFYVRQWHSAAGLIGKPSSLKGAKKWLLSS